MVEIVYMTMQYERYKIFVLITLIWVWNTWNQKQSNDIDSAKWPIKLSKKRDK